MLLSVFIQKKYLYIKTKVYGTNATFSIYTKKYLYIKTIVYGTSYNIIFNSRVSVFYVSTLHVIFS